jgi:hypothetical protein
MPSRAHSAPPQRHPAAGPSTVAGQAVQPTARPPTPDEVADLVNRDELTVTDANVLLTAMAEPPLKLHRPATFTVPVAVRVPAGTRPAAAMAHLDAIVHRARTAMAWTTLHDIDEYAIDLPVGGASSACSEQVQVHANIRITVTVAAYVLYRFASTVRRLLDDDLQHLRDAGAELGAARRARSEDQDNEDEDEIFDLDPAEGSVVGHGPRW